MVCKGIFCPISAMSIIDIYSGYLMRAGAGFSKSTERLPARGRSSLALTRRAGGCPLAPLVGAVGDPPPAAAGGVGGFVVFVGSGLSGGGALRPRPPLAAPLPCLAAPLPCRPPSLPCSFVARSAFGVLPVLARPPLAALRGGRVCAAGWARSPQSLRRRSGVGGGRGSAAAAVGGRRRVGRGRSHLYSSGFTFVIGIYICNRVRVGAIPPLSIMGVFPPSPLVGSAAALPPSRCFGGWWVCPPPAPFLPPLCSFSLPPLLGGRSLFSPRCPAPVLLPLSLRFSPVFLRCFSFFVYLQHVYNCKFLFNYLKLR